MGPNEVIDELKKRGVNITVRTLQNWVNAGLIPKPERGRKGNRWQLGRLPTRNSTRSLDRTPSKGYTAFEEYRDSRGPERLLRREASTFYSDAWGRLWSY